MALVTIIFVSALVLLFVLLFRSLFIKTKDKSNLLNIGIVFIIIFFVFLGFLLNDSIKVLEHNTDFTKIGPYGDYIGGVINPLISVFAVFAAGFAFYAQYQANMQVQEQFEKQEKKDYRQNFENIFFNLINIHHQIVSDIDIDVKKIYHFENDLKNFLKENEFMNSSYTKNLIDEGNYSSRDVFNYYFNLLDYLIWIDLQIQNGVDLETFGNDIIKFEKIFKIKNIITYEEYSLISRFPSIYALVYNTISSDFGHYFRNLYRIIKYIDSMEFSKDKLKDFKIKYSYSSIIRSQLSDAELKVLFFNCIYYYGNKKFKPLLEKYSFFKFINTDEDDSDNVFKDFFKFYDMIAYEPIVDDKLMTDYLNNHNLSKLIIKEIKDEVEIKLSV